MRDKNELPSPARLLAIAFAALILVSLAKAILTESQMPLLWPLLTCFVAATLLHLVRPEREAAASFMRAGFYIGLFAFFLTFPVFSPDDVNPDLSDEAHQILGLSLLLTVLGFEVVYWTSRLSRETRYNSVSPFAVSATRRRWLFIALYIGISAWFVGVWDYAMTTGAPISTVLLTMRGVVEGERDNVASSLSYLSLALGAGIFLAATAASVLLIASRVSKISAAICWLTILMCAVVGFLNGTRAFFLYSFVPLVVTSWMLLSRQRLGRSMRLIWAAMAAVVLIVVWGAMSAMRGDDIRKYEGGLEMMAPTHHAQGALDVYSMTAIVVETFPDRVPYEYGKSLIPLVLGWVPRAMWIDKPYPFSLHMNIINGETLEFRSASIAVGLTGEGYGNFGLLGALIWGALMGFACRKGDDYIARFHPGNPLRLQMAAMAGIWAAMIMRGGVAEMFYMGLQIIIIPWALAKFLSYKTRELGAQQRLPQPIDGLRAVDRKSQLAP